MTDKFKKIFVGIDRSYLTHHAERVGEEYIGRTMFFEDDGYKNRRCPWLMCFFEVS